MVMKKNREELNCVVTEMESHQGYTEIGDGYEIDSIVKNFLEE